MTQEINVFLDQNEAEAQRAIHGPNANVRKYDGIKVYDHRGDPRNPKLVINESQTVYVVYKIPCND